MHTKAMNGVDLLEGVPSVDDASARLQREGERQVQLDKDTFGESVIAQADGMQYDATAVASAMRRLGISADQFKTTHDAAVAVLKRRRADKKILDQGPAMAAQRVELVAEREQVNANIEKMLQEPRQTLARINCKIAKLESAENDRNFAEHRMIESAPEHLLAERAAIAQKQTIAGNQLTALRREQTRLADAIQGFLGDIRDHRSEMQVEEAQDNLAHHRPALKAIEAQLATAQAAYEELAARDAAILSQMMIA